jgi:hypothetical protein
MLTRATGVSPGLRAGRAVSDAGDPAILPVPGSWGWADDDDAAQARCCDAGLLGPHDATIGS